MTDICPPPSTTAASIIATGPSPEPNGGAGDLYHNGGQRCNNYHQNEGLNLHQSVSNNKINRTMSCSPKNEADDQNDQSASTSSSTATSTTTGSSKNSSSNDNGDVKRALKSLLKKVIDPSQDFIKSHNKHVKFSETMQVFCYELPDNQMPQIIALKQQDSNPMEFQTFMYDPPAEYQDLLTFEPPPDYRDFIANSLNGFQNKVTFDFIVDDDDDSENESKDPKQNYDNHKLGRHTDSLMRKDSNQNSKWQSMILNNNLDSLEEEQIIGVLKEDDILQAIGSQVTLPVNPAKSNGDGESGDDPNDPRNYEFEIVEGTHHYDENLSSEDFPVHHLNSYFLNSSGHLEEDDEEACCIDSSPNGSLQDLASDSSITSQDTIILINQNKTFHLDSVPNDSINNSINENIYENIQPPSSNINMVSHVVNGDGTGNSSPAAATGNNKTDSSASKEQQNQREALYENTGELLAASSLVANHVKNFEKRLSSSSSEDSKSGSELETKPATTHTNGGGPPNKANVFKQNILFYEKMVGQPTANGARNNKQLHEVHNANSSMPTATMQASPNQSLKTTQYPGGTHVMVSNNLMPLPCYAILETNRTSSSSSLSSASSSSSIVPPTVSCSSSSPTCPAAQTSPSLPSSIPTTRSQASPNPSSNSSSSGSSSASSHMANESFAVCQTSSSQSSSTSLAQSSKNQSPASASGNTTATAQINFAIAGDKNNFSNAEASAMNASYSNISGQPHIPMGQRMPTGGHHPAQHICIVNQLPQNGTPLRPGQVIYRYPYAVIQPGMNGISTIRPVQYIVQAAPAGAGSGSSGSGTSSGTSSPSIIYNPKLVVGNPVGSYTISPVPNSSSSSSSSSASGAPGNVVQKNTATAIIQQAQIVVPNHSAGDSATGTAQIAATHAVPVRRIIVPQGTAVLAPRIMQLHHPQHGGKQHPTAPAYQCYVQQRAPTVMAYQPNVQIRHTVTRTAQFCTSDMQHSPNMQQNQPNLHTEFPHPSEIRRRDGLYPYPQVLIRKEDGVRSSQKPNDPGAVAGAGANPEFEEKDELEAFVQQEQQRTERIKKRYSFTEDDDPTFGFARRPSVRGIRSKLGNDQQTTAATAAAVSGAPKTTVVHQINPNNVVRHHQQPHAIFLEKTAIAAGGTLPKNLQHQQFIQINHQQQPQQMISIVKQIGDMHVISKNIQPQPGQNIQLIKSQTLPRHLSQAHKISVANSNGGGTEPHHEIVRLIDASQITMVNGPATMGTLPRDQQKLAIHLQQQQQQQQKSNNSTGGQQQQPQIHKSLLVQRINNPNTSADLTNANGGGFSPNHPPAPPMDSAATNQKDPKQQQQHPSNLVNNEANGNKANNNAAAASDLVYYSLNV